MRLLLALLLCALATGCATITGGPTQEMTVQARGADEKEVTGALCVLKNERGSWNVTTPGKTTVKRSNERMEVTCTKSDAPQGSLSVESATRLAMMANIILPGGTAMAMMDHASGAAYEYPEAITVIMGKALALDVPKVHYARVYEGDDGTLERYGLGPGVLATNSTTGGTSTLPARAPAVAAASPPAGGATPRPPASTPVAALPDTMFGRVVSGSVPPAATGSVAALPESMFGRVVSDSQIGGTPLVLRSASSLQATQLENLHLRRVPAETGYALLRDIDAAPILKDEGKAGLMQYSLLPAPKAFVIYQDGSWRLRAGRPDAMTSLLDQCASEGRTCWLYAVDDRVVWHPRTEQRIGHAGQLQPR